MRKDQIQSAGGAADFLPERLTLPALRLALQQCRGCDLYKNATQGVLGAGPRHAAMLLVGEQPGDQEDLAGKPFVGPAGRILDQALQEAAIARQEVFLTNAVKHFKFVRRGKRRLHVKPALGEVKACRPWLEAEIKLVQPQIIVCLGATAAQALLGPAFRVTQQRGRVLPGAWAEAILATVHPSSILRMPDHESRDRAFHEFVSDLTVAQKHLRAG